MTPQSPLPRGMPASAPAVVPIARLDLVFEPRPWPFAAARRTEIDAHFADLKRHNPALWNGRVLLLHHYSVNTDIFQGAYLETDYASMLAWRDWGFPDRAIWNCFGMAAVRSVEGAFLLGVMAAHTANAGLTYFPAGTVDPDDVVGGRIDLEGSLRRELAEETGLDIGQMNAQTGWHAVFAGPRIAVMKILQASESAAVLKRRALQHLADQTQPELADIRIARSRADIDASFPGHTAAFLHYCWRTENH